MLENCHSVHEVIYLYRRRYGLPVRSLAGRPTVVTGQRLGVVSMPAVLGVRVAENVDPDSPMPVISDPRDHRWAFLVAPDRMVRTGLAVLLAHHDVRVAPQGRQIMLPISDSGTWFHWKYEPTDGPMLLPPRTTVLRAVRAMATDDLGPGRR